MNPNKEGKKIKAWASEFFAEHHHMSLFHTKKAAAQEFMGLPRDGRPEIIPVTITYQLPKQSKKV